MRVCICECCGWMRLVSRRSKVECFKCGRPQMVEVKLSYQKFGSMSEDEREAYAKSWLYIHDMKEWQDKR